MTIQEVAPDVRDEEPTTEEPELIMDTLRSLGKKATHVSRLTREDIVDYMPSTD